MFSRGRRGGDAEGRVGEKRRGWGHAVLLPPRTRMTYHTDVKSRGAVYITYQMLSLLQDHKSSVES